MGTPHRTITTDVYHFEQLSDEAKEKARDWWRQAEAEDPAWANERRESLEAFCKEFPIEVKGWEYDAYSYRIHKVWTAGSDSQAIKGKRLIGFLLAEYGPRILWEPKVYEKDGKKRRSKVTVVATSCKLTGYCMDECLLDPIRKYLKAPDMNLHYCELLAQCLDAWGQACVDDVADSMKDEQVDETIIANEYEFDEEGCRV